MSPACKIWHLMFKIIYSLPHNNIKLESTEIQKNDKTTLEGKINTCPSFPESYIPLLNSLNKATALALDCKVWVKRKL